MHFEFFPYRDRQATRGQSEKKPDPIIKLAVHGIHSTELCLPLLQADHPYVKIERI